MILAVPFTAFDAFDAGDDADAKAKVLELARSDRLPSHRRRSAHDGAALEAMGTLNISLRRQHGWPWATGYKLVGPTPEKPAATS